MTLPILWFVLIAVLWIGYLTLEGFDFCERAIQRLQKRAKGGDKEAKFELSVAPQAEKLYILGDLFDFWIGDDEKSELISEVQELIKNLTKQDPRRPRLKRGRRRAARRR